MTAPDVFSITNPALTSLLLWSFLEGFETGERSGCSFPLIFLPLPLVLSQSIRDDFKGTNAATGLYSWITRRQKILINLDTRINKTASLTRTAIMFGASNGIITIEVNGTLKSNNRGIVKSRLKSNSDEIKEMIGASNKLGVWFSQIDSTSSILNSLGLTV
ncbi:three component ABC system middle component [Paenibacillus tyrfis]|uniref:three component ABC system middle component n=1 Tax=Paenibacillus tyrfis TaxID=1501230 RepID=UPI00117CFC19|nr:three component ABC system middle component [Paenibacillus tyrfis]